MFADIAKTANSKSNESRMEMTTIFSSNSTKGQLISQCPFGVIVSKVSFFGQCSKMQLIPLQNFIIKTCFIQFLWFFRLKCWFKGQIISRIHLSLPNAYKLMCFDRNINGNRDDKFFDWDYWSLHWPKKLTLIKKLDFEKTKPT